MSSSFTYKDSGVDVKAGEALVQSIKEVVKSTHNVNVLSNIGGFGGLFRPDFSSYSDPVLVSSVDGVGTKLMVAFKAGIYDTVGQDLVNHCVNDIAVCGADPLFFLDYFATGKLDNSVAEQVISGFAKACRENNSALIGGETAEMPDMYNPGEFDVSGTIVGIVDRNRIFDGSKVKKGDVVIGLPSTGLHTNGYSLARKVLFSKYKVDQHVAELGSTLGEALLKVHKSYLPVIQKLRNFEYVHAFSHITGGGIEGNTNRVIPEGCSLHIDWDSWQRPAIFELIKTIGNVPEEDIRMALNLGIGLCIIVDRSMADNTIAALSELNETAHVIGEIK